MDKGFVYIFTDGENYGVASVQPSASNSPPDCCIPLFESYPHKGKEEFPQNASATVRHSCQHPAGMPSAAPGFSHGLKNMPPACFLPSLCSGRPFKSHIYPRNKKPLLEQSRCLTAAGWIRDSLPILPLGKNCKEWPGPYPARNSPLDCFS